jgi:hypothetical protein
MWRWRLILNDWPCAGAYRLNTCVCRKIHPFVPVTEARNVTRQMIALLIFLVRLLARPKAFV